MSFTLSEQFVCLCCAFLSGLMIGVLYDCFRIVRLYMFKGKLSVFICDFLFMVLCAFVSVGFSVAFSRGNTRYFTLIGEGGGFLLYRLTIGRFSTLIIGWFLNITYNLIQKSIVKIGKICKRVLQPATQILYNICKKKEKAINTMASPKYD